MKINNSDEHATSTAIAYIIGMLAFKNTIIVAGLHSYLLL